MLAGGLAAGAAGTVWLIASGAWPYFVESVLVWNREYVAHDSDRRAILAVRRGPRATDSSRGSCVHLVAVPVAVPSPTFWRGTISWGRCSLGFYLGWLLQGLLPCNTCSITSTSRRCCSASPSSRRGTWGTPITAASSSPAC